MSVVGIDASRASSIIIVIIMYVDFELKHTTNTLNELIEDMRLVCCFFSFVSFIMILDDFIL